jgi:hypothetical protein
MAGGYMPSPGSAGRDRPEKVRRYFLPPPQV